MKKNGTMTMMNDNVFFTSDLHLGHKFGAEVRGFSSVEEHDEAVLNGLREVMTKRTKIFFLGDVAFTRRGLEKLGEIKKGSFVLFMGNHDQLKAVEYLKVFDDVKAFAKYRNFWISHAPIHPQEMWRCTGNIHGHIHNGAATPPLPLPYFNVNVDFHDYHPIPFNEIKHVFEQWEKDNV